LSSLRRAAWSFRRHGAPVAKRAFDLLVSAVSLLLLAPGGLLIATAIKLESPGPVFFRQVRVGRNGRQFMLWKFRSMYQDAERRKRDLFSSSRLSGGIRFKMKRDPRVTRIGRLLRASSMDELPQLINIFRGDMSLVGPRPPIPSEVEQYTPQARRRLEGVPGLTCIWQVSGRSEIPFERQVKMDLDYLERSSLRFDLILLLRTFPAVLLGRGAY
jgi:lipopolysaccharide/colanic/teichoic acid biosynthesis glycosyltransferase